MTPAIVEVVWRDAVLRPGSSSLRRASSVAKPAIRHTVGYLIEKTRRDLKLAVTFDPKEPDDADHYVDDLYYIPRQWVVRLTVLRRKEK